MSIATQRRSYTYDVLQTLKDVSAALTASAALQVGGSAKVFDTEPNQGLLVPSLFTGVAVIDISAIDISSADEIYDIVIQGSDSATFASGIENLACLNLGATAVRDGGAINSLVGRYELLFMNEQNGVNYRYIRGYLRAQGTTPSIAFTVQIGRQPIFC